ncbi:multicopper oxidase family protein [Labrys wisconsinensis]|uniref:FtsP/CotA-like multicopper oxidase with cupredoxin domain n=1 Tax=Labrys wisconsinensis TaxID=425677 RepID=A0ABU0J3V8_9HYPH|nr:multicopper oxidase domain-containing protein [Labrys wisconsinensis]MDQ0468919.1 FtsP/CotA-like multicopper oxidase with cupredoxin domain [Labrys wisconsinensis]
MPRDRSAPVLSRRTVLGIAALAALPRGPAAAAGPDPLVLTAAPADLRLDGPERPPIAASAYNGVVPGPPIRVRRGGEVFARLVNHLDRPTALHWHGVRLVNAMDGAPPLTQAPVAPGGSFDYRFTVPDAGTFLYHAAGASDRDSGLYGVLVVEETEPPPIDRDMVLVLDRWRPDGRPPMATVNSERDTEIALRRNERLRLRLVNAASDSVAALAFAGIGPLVVALDGQPVNAPFAPDRLRLDLAPGGRADVLIDGTAGDLAGMALIEGSNVVEIVRFVPAPGKPARAEALPPPAPLPRALPARIDLAAARRAELKLDAPAGPDGAPLLAVKRGTPVTLALVNDTDAVNAVHVHGHTSRLLHPLDDGWEPYWLDTVLVPAGETVHIAFIADNPGRWLVECRAIGRSGAAGSTWFEVT